MYEWAVWPQAVEIEVDVDELRNISPIDYLFVAEDHNNEISKFLMRIIQDHLNIHRRSDG